MFVIIAVIVVIIIIFAISNRGEKITHHHAKPHFDQIKNTVSVTTTRSNAKYEIHKIVSNNHGDLGETDPDEIVYKGHDTDPPATTTSTVLVATMVNTFSNGTKISVPLPGNGLDYDVSSLVVTAPTNDGRIGTTAPVSSNQLDVRPYTVTFPIGNYGTSSPPLPTISGLNNWHVSVIPGSIVSITDVNVSPADMNKIDADNFTFLTLQCTVVEEGTTFFCPNVNDIINYFSVGDPRNPVGPISGNNGTFCFLNPDMGMGLGNACVIPNLLMNVSFTLTLTGGVGGDQFMMENPITFTLTIDERPLSASPPPCGTTNCPPN